MKTHSLLSRTIAQKISEEHKKDLTQDGHISLALHVFRDIDDTGIPAATVFELKLPNDQQGKQRYFFQLKEHLEKKGPILEALIIFEGWTVWHKQSRERREVLQIMGRNRDKTRVTMVQQCFSHKPGGEVVWEEVKVEEFNVPGTKDGEFQVIGLIDYLFPPLN